MNIKIKLYGQYKKNRFSEATKEFPENTIVKDVVKSLDIPENSRGIILVNGHSSNKENILQNDDTITFFPMVSGG